MTRTDFIATYVLNNTHAVGPDAAVADAIRVADLIYGVA